MLQGRELKANILIALTFHIHRKRLGSFPIRQRSTDRQQND